MTVPVHSRGSDITRLLYSYPKASVGWQRAQNLPPVCQRHGRVLDPAHGMAQLKPSWDPACSGDQNPCLRYALLLINFNLPLSRSFKPPAARFAAHSDSGGVHTQRRNSAYRNQTTHWHQSSQEKNGGQPRGNGVSQPIQRRLNRRRVLDPDYLMNQMGPMGMLSGDQNPTEDSTIRNKIACGFRRIASKHRYYPRTSRPRCQQPPVSLPRRQLTRQESGSWYESGGLLGGVGSGVQRTTGSRHPRRRVLASGKSMIRGGSMGGWNRDQYPTDRYGVGIKNSCDSDSQFVRSWSTTQPQAYRRQNGGQPGDSRTEASASATIRAHRPRHRVPDPDQLLPPIGTTDSHSGLGNSSDSLVSTHKSRFGHQLSGTAFPSGYQRPINCSLYWEVGR
ncbi:hypothetical protein HISP_15976 [Haloarcula hispanica N601]|uniref:Uncharacterized protein n=2 Tax=Haloarcula hispanica TaxID=51589 RepID=W0GHU8_HALHI|nr:hypothetical protein HAH_4036 [Haloarcula hispanica ATCC 33960]AHF55874.1 hypothetical protein HISP_15976 [Haloarcula hispanica N601]